MGSFLEKIKNNKSQNKSNEILTMTHVIKKPKKEKRISVVKSVKNHK